MCSLLMHMLSELRGAQLDPTSSRVSNPDLLRTAPQFPLKRGFWDAKTRPFKFAPLEQRFDGAGRCRNFVSWEMISGSMDIFVGLLKFDF